MNRALLAWLLGGGLLAYLIYSQRQPLGSAIQTGVEDVTASVQGWKNVNNGPLWVPVLRTSENAYGIPTDLLSRIAYQESRFRPDTIDGTHPGAAGELGIMQLMPRYFASVQVPVPFSAQDVAAQIEEAARLMSQLYAHYRDWGLVVAAYNDGQGNIDAYLQGTHTLPASTAEYVAEVLADVPVPGTLPV